MANKTFTLCDVLCPVKLKSILMRNVYLILFLLLGTSVFAQSIWSLAGNLSDKDKNQFFSLLILT
jgi:hypothetical protein